MARGRQAMEAMMRYCFEELQLERFYLDHYTGNPVGFLYDVHLMSMLREEYVRRNQK